jgi:hypothetical protein
MILAPTPSVSAVSASYGLRGHENEERHLSISPPEPPSLVLDMDERPAKRARQACGRCRRKKTRCPGEKPVCSFCARLAQTYTYSDSTSALVQDDGGGTRVVRDAGNPASLVRAGNEACIQ